eukprot:6047680-Prymnesium_polylepis.1
MQAACAAHSGCATFGLQGDCCPTPGGVSLGCCDAALLLPPPSSPSVALTPTSLESGCGAHPGCAALVGDCCPASRGVFLGCCEALPAVSPLLPLALPPPPPPSPPPPTEPALSESTSCTAHPGCAVLVGDCCPASSGVRLGCCGPL